MSELIKSTTPREVRQFINVYDVVDDYSGYYLTVDHEAGDVIVWNSEGDEDRRFRMAAFQESVAWLRTSDDGATRDQDDLGQWTKLAGGDVELLLPCGDTVTTNVREMEALVGALTMMQTAKELTRSDILSVR